MQGHTDDGASKLSMYSRSSPPVMHEIFDALDVDGSGFVDVMFHGTDNVHLKFRQRMQLTEDFLRLRQEHCPGPPAAFTRPSRFPQ